MKSRGFTIIEILVAFSITAILSSIGLASFVSYQKRQALDQTILALQNDIAFAKAKAQIQEIPPACVTAAPAGLKGYQLKFGSDGLSYEVLAVCNDGTEISLSPQRTVNFPQNVRKTEGPGWIRFLVLTGSAQAGTGAVSTNPTDGKWEVRVAHGDRAKAISVTTEGGISTLALGSVTPSPTAIPTLAPTSTPGPTSTPTMTSTPTLTPTPTPIVKRVFVTSTTYNGDIKGFADSLPGQPVNSGVEGADKICQNRADAVSLDGVWKAWFSDRVSSSPSIRFSDTVRSTTNPVIFKLVNQITTIADNWTDLVDSTLDSRINRDEFDVSVLSSNVWTGTDSNGNPAISFASFSTFCEDWTTQNDGPDGVYGSTTTTSSSWTRWGVLGCNRTHRLYCFEQ